MHLLASYSSEIEQVSERFVYGTEKPWPFSGLSRFCRMKPRLPIQGSLFEASIAGLEQVHGVYDLQISSYAY